MQYNQDLFRKFHALAITNVSDLVIGKTYFTNTGDSFVLLSLETNGKHYKSEGLKWRNGQTKHLLGWMVTNKRKVSLHDNNIGASYNPWLIFDNEHLAKACEEMLVINWPSYDYEWDY